MYCLTDIGKEVHQAHEGIHRDLYVQMDAVYSQNAPADYQMNDKAQMEYDLLQDILNLCSIYY